MNLTEAWCGLTEAVHDAAKAFKDLWREMWREPTEFPHPPKQLFKSVPAPRVRLRRHQNR